MGGDDRTPAWTWIGYLYHDQREVVIDADNIMTILRDAGSKVPTGRRNGTYKRQTQEIVLGDVSAPLMINSNPMAPIFNLEEEPDFARHLERVEAMGFELLVKRVRIGTNKHVRVRPMFRKWQYTFNWSLILQ